MVFSFGHVWIQVECYLICVHCANLIEQYYCSIDLVRLRICSPAGTILISRVPEKSNTMILLLYKHCIGYTICKIL